MKGFAYHHGATGVAWYRIWQIVKYLQKQGIDISRLPNESDRITIPFDNGGKSNYPGIKSHIDIALENDFIIAQCPNTRKEAFRLIEQGQRTDVIVDLDDDIFNIDPTNPNFAAWLPQPDQITELKEGEENNPRIKERVEKQEGVVCEEKGRKFFVVPGEDKRENVVMCLSHLKAITVSTEALKKAYSKFNKNVFVIPNGIDFELWNPKPNMTDEFRIGLFGSNTHYKDWKEAVDGVKRFLSETSNAKLVSNASLTLINSFIGERFENAESRPKLPDYFEDLFKSGRLELHKPCEVEKYPAWLADKRVDVILAPLADNAFNRGKSNIKYLEASALKIPTICADLEPYQKDITHGYNGFLAKQPIDYYKFLKRLHSNALERQAMGNRAYLDVKTRYGMESIAVKYGQMLKNLLGIENEKADSRILSAV